MRTKESKQILKSEDPGEFQSRWTHTGGRSAAFEEISHFLKEQVAELFVQRQDTLAKYLRDTILERVELARREESRQLREFIEVDCED